MEGFSLDQKTFPLHPHGFNMAPKFGFRPESTYIALLIAWGAPTIPGAPIIQPC
jgi:hypothetical protein